MFAYYFKLGVRSLRRNPALTALMVLTLAIGVAASVSTLTILHMMSNDPIPQKSDRLFVPLIDNGRWKATRPGEKPGDIQISYQDAMNILKSGQGVRRTALYGVAAAGRAAAQARSRPSPWAAWRRRATSSRCSTCPSCTARPGAEPTTRGADVVC
jgi:hypothetical protein